MLDFRYHALTLVAVFLALGVGIVLGSSLGDTIVSGANKDIAASLRDDLTKARGDASAARTGLGDRENLIGVAFPRLAGGKLNRVRVALVASGGLPQNVQLDVRDAVQRAGGTLTSASDIKTPPDIPTLGTTVARRFAGMAPGDPRLRPMGRQIGQALVRGRRLAQRLAKAFPSRFAGDFKSVDAIAFYRDPGPSRSQDDLQLEQGLIDGLRAAGKPVVGIERTDTTPSEISFYSKQGISSVDNVDSAGGRVALVLALAGARGSFGYKSTADSPLPNP